MIQTPIFLDSLVLRFAIKHKQNLGFAYDEGLLYLYEIHDIELIRAKSKFNELIENEDVEFPEIDKSLVKKSCLVIPIKYVSLIDVNCSYWLHLLSEDDSYHYINDCIKKSYSNLVCINIEHAQTHIIQCIVKFLPYQTNFKIISGELEYFKAKEKLEELKNSKIKEFIFSKRLDDYDDLMELLEYLSGFESLRYAELSYKPEYATLEKERYSKYIEEEQSKAKLNGRSLTIIINQSTYDVDQFISSFDSILSAKNLLS